MEMRWKNVLKLKLIENVVQNKCNVSILIILFP